jgi:murein DD-endopeptidase MepM/ murein hydrolase activator NlpD
VVPSAVAYAGLLDWISSKASAGEIQSQSDVRRMTLLEGNHNPNPQTALGGGDITIVDGSALASETSPLAGSAVALGSSDQISVYVVREGDTLSQIADMFGVTINTIRWANDIPAKGSIRPEQTLVILPITGVKHIVKKGDTLASIIKKYKADKEEVLQFNGLENGASLAAGDELIIPHGEIVPAANSSSSGSGKAPSYGGGPSYAGYYMRPVGGGIRTQGIHGFNGVDLSSSYGAAIYAAAAGEVIISKSEGWNGGYGSYIVIKHDNGTQTLYAHLSTNSVSVGQTVAQGETIGAMGASGKATGTHLHFEIRGAKNPF